MESVRSEPPEFLPPVSRHPKGLIVPIVVLLAGVAAITITAIVENRQYADAPWAHAILAPNAPLPDGVPGVIPVKVRRLTHPLSDNVQQLTTSIQTVADLDPVLDEFIKGEYVVLMEEQPDVLPQMLASGRLPEHGKPEAVAGYLAQGTTFKLDDQQVQVVGRLRPSVGGVQYSFIMFGNNEYASLFDAEGDALSGWIDPTGEDRLETLVKSLDTEDTEEFVILPAQSRTETVYTLSAIMGLILVAAGGTLALYRLLARLYHRRQMQRLMEAEEALPIGMFEPVLGALVKHPVSFAALNIAFYATMFVLMLVAIETPLLNYRLSNVVSGAFTEGDLKYVGLAYASGNIWWAAFATFQQNFLVATVFANVLPSLIIPFFGPFRNLVSFAFIGFIMSPLWIGSTQSYIYHSITMVIELQAYIIASFAMILWPLKLIQGIRQRRFGAEAVSGLALVGSATALAAIILIIAAVYEAVTLILLD